MAFVTTQPEALSAAATSLQGIGYGIELPERVGGGSHDGRGSGRGR